jgi:hypothetical protein
MTPETKFRGLEMRAKVHLSRPLDAPELAVDLDRAAVVVLLWRYPAFESYQSWALIKGGTAKEERWLVRRTSWKRSIDYQRAADPLKHAALLVDPAPTPTIEILDARTEADFAAGFLQRLGDLAIHPLLPSDGIGIDGVVNGIEMQGGQIHLEWWCDGPPAWRAFTEGVERLRLDLDAAVLANRRHCREA